MSKKVLNLQNDIKLALRGRDTAKLSTLKFLLSKINNAQIEMRGSGKEFDDADFGKVASKEIKAHKESIEAYKKAGRDDLVQKERTELDILEQYAPKMMDEAAIKAVVDAKYKELREIGEPNFGTLMKEVMGELKGKADGKLAQSMVRDVLSS
jgi:uncharacterized protein YqeY